MYAIRMSNEADLWLRDIDTLAHGGRGEVRMVGGLDNALNFATVDEALRVAGEPLLKSLGTPVLVKHMDRPW